MKRFYQIIACFFAILIASPVMCCGAHLATDATSVCQKGCCQTDCKGSGDAPLEKHCCGCQVQSPRESESTPVLLVAPTFDRLPPMFPVSILLALRPAPTADSMVAGDSYDPRPPRLRLALLQRFRI